MADDDMTSTTDELRKAALIDLRFQAHLRSEAGEASTILLDALQAGSQHPSFADAIGWIEDLVSECRQLIASYTADQGSGCYPVEVFGFDSLCVVWAPEYGASRPLPTIEEATGYVVENFGEFLVEGPRWARRTTPARATHRSQSSGKAAAPSDVARFRIAGQQFSKFGENRFVRHRSRLLDSDRVFTLEQLVAYLCGLTSGIVDESELQRQVCAAGWRDVAAAVTEARCASRQELEARRSRDKETFRQDAVAFIEARLQGRADPEGRLLDAAAREWAWLPYNQTVGDGTATEEPRWRGARDRYQRAVLAYKAAKHQ